MQRFYAIYDTKHKKYFTDNPFYTTNLTNSALLAKWFCSRLAAVTFIEQYKKL